MPSILQNFSIKNAGNLTVLFRAKGTVYWWLMGKAARAIIIEDGKLLVMHRNKSGSQYYTLVGGRANADETPEQAVVREVREETGMEVTAARLVFVENHPEPYNTQYIFVCEVAAHGEVAIQDTSEEGFMNRLSINLHQPFWVEAGAFPRLSFRTPQLQEAITQALKKGFPSEPQNI
jgi:ADP-ribose pyrophosphatase YjhB (NUDIX family)